MTQFIANGFIAASTVVIVAIGFALIFETTRFFHFTHGAVFTFGAYSAYTFRNLTDMPIWIVFLAAMGASLVLGCLLVFGVYNPLRRRNASSLTLLLASLGLYVLLQNTISLRFGDDTKTIRTNTVSEGSEVFGARITSHQIVIIATSIAFIFFVYLLLKKSRFGKAMRAVASDPELAKASGINTDRVIVGVFAVGSALAGAAGTLVALDVGMTPTMGMNALMMGVVAVIVGGIRSVPGIVLGALLLGMAQQLGVWKISSQWQEAIAFIILLVFLVFRPQGFMGKEVRKATV